MSLTNPVPLTKDYTPSVGYLGQYFFMQNRPPFMPGLHVPQMLADPRIIFGLWVIKGPLLARGRFYVDCEDVNVKEFLVKNVTRFWRNSAVEAYKAIEWGWSGSEVMYKSERDGTVNFDYLKGLNSRDVKPRTTEGRLTSIKVNGGKSGPVRLGGMKGFWHTHGHEHHSWFGRSRLFGSYPAWLETWTPDGFRDMRRLFFHKYAYRGHVVRYPNIKLTNPDGTEETIKELVRNACEKWKTGGDFFIPHLGSDPERQITVEPAVVNPPPEGLFEYGQDLKAEIWEGMGIPPEVARAETSTGAYAGRRIPLLAFYSSLQELLGRMIADADDQIFRPLVRLNFGDVPYEIVPFPLMKDEAEEAPSLEEGQDAAGEQPVGGVQFADTNGHGDIVFATAHARKGGITIGGKFFRGGEWIPGDVVKRATPEEREQLGMHDNKSQVPLLRTNANKFLHASGKKVDKEIHDRAVALRLDPAWVGVRIAVDPKARLLAVGYDAKGRQQRVYSAKHSKKSAAEKFARVREFMKELPGIRKRYRKALAGKDGPEKEAAAVLALIDATGFRIGSERDTGAEKQAYGASTLHSGHVKVHQGKVIFSFIAKKGVAARQEVTDPVVVSLVTERAQRNGKLFNTNDRKVRDYLHGIDGVFMPKDFRTAVAAETALRAMATMPIPSTAAEFKAQRSQVGKIVAAKLGNTPSVALESYIPPEVFGKWEAQIMKAKKGQARSSKTSSTQRTTAT